MPIIVQCEHCHRDYPIKPYMKPTARFCSRSCKALAQVVHIKKDCEVCAKEFDHISSRCNKAKYCSRQCYHKAQRLKGTVEYTCKHCSMKFLGAPSHKRVYCSRACVSKSEKSIWKANYTTVRKNMKRRKLLTECQRCGYSKNLNILGVHHRDRDRNNNELSNLEVLCANCHSEEHNKHIEHGLIV